LGTTGVDLALAICTGLHRSPARNCVAEGWLRGRYS
jgi:hypothetical protein